MTDPVSQPSELFPAREDPKAPHPWLYPEPELPEPVLLATHIPWQPGSEHNNPQPPATFEPLKDETGRQLDHLELGGKITICVLCYGNFHQTHRTCLDSIHKTVPRERRDLRIACNQCPTETIKLARSLEPTVVYVNDTNKLKYPTMRQMFWDPSNPITTAWVAWFDDNAWVRHLNWVNIVADDIHRQTEAVAAFGPRMYRTFKLAGSKDPRNWFREADWYQGLDFRTKRGNAAPNGDTIHFCADWFFLLRTDAIRRCNIPDPRLGQKGGDIALGEQLYQNGYKIKDFNSAKNLVFTPPASQGLRRGGKEPFPWQ